MNSYVDVIAIFAAHLTLPLPYAAVPYPIPAPASVCGGRTLLPAAPPRSPRDPADAAPLLPPPRRAHEPHGHGLALPLQPAALQGSPSLTDSNPATIYVPLPPLVLTAGGFAGSQLILGSSSVARKHILEEMGLEFQVMVRRRVTLLARAPAALVLPAKC